MCQYRKRPCQARAPACAAAAMSGVGSGQHSPAHTAATANGRPAGAALCGSGRGRRSAGSRGSGRAGSGRVPPRRAGRSGGSGGSGAGVVRTGTETEAAPGRGRWSSPVEQGRGMRGWLETGGSSTLTACSFTWSPPRKASPWSSLRALPSIA